MVSFQPFLSMKTQVDLDESSLSDDFPVSIDVFRHAQHDEQDLIVSRWPRHGRMLRFMRSHRLF
jgi:hypothetical protein